KKPATSGGSGIAELEVFNESKSSSQKVTTSPGQTLKVVQGAPAGTNPQAAISAAVGSAISSNIPASAVVGAVAQPEVQKTLAVQSSLGKLDAQYGGRDKIPDAVKQQTLQAAGVQVPAGTTPDQALSALQGNARDRVIASAKANGGMNDKQAGEVARMVGLGD
ncbi:MAG: hypothetical protein REI12_02755, partial [Pedobacter sp.]|nr:hypothetical protein [Pedobacter sp.]